MSEFDTLPIDEFDLEIEKISDNEFTVVITVEIGTGGGTSLTAQTLGDTISDADEKTTPVDADNLVISDSEAGNIAKKFTWANLKSVLASVFAASSHNHSGVYSPVSHNHSGVYSTVSHNHSGVYDPAGTAAGVVATHEGEFEHGDIHASGSDAETAATIATILTGAAAQRITEDDEMPFYKVIGGLLKKMTLTSFYEVLAVTFSQTNHTHGQLHDASGQFNQATPAEISGLTDKTTPVDADVLLIEDSETAPTAFGKKKLTWANIKTVLGSVFAASGHNHSGSYSDFNITINTSTDSYVLVLTDANTLRRMNKGTANNLTIPLNSSVPFPIGTRILTEQIGAGQTTIVATGGVTTNSCGNRLKIAAQYCGAMCLKTDTDTWWISGDLIL